MSRCKSRDIDALEALADARQSSVTRMLKIEDERRGAVQHARLRHRSHRASRSSSPGAIRPARWSRAYDECATRARRCRDLNDRNGILVGAQMKRVEGLLGAITGAPAQPRAYGPRGQAAYYGAGAGQVISAEA